MFFGVMAFFTGLLALFFLLAAFSSSVMAGLIMGGVYALLLSLGTVAYRRFKSAWEWEQGTEIREMEAIRLKSNPKPCPLSINQ